MTPPAPVGPGPQGYLALVLHAHLPYVRHPEHPAFLEENWLYEGITETYIPLLLVFDRLAEEGIPYRLAVSITPTLGSMWEDSLLQERYTEHLDNLVHLAEQEVHRTRFQPEYHRLACMYRDRFGSVREAYHQRYQRDLIGAFRRLQDAGHVEILASAATHAYLPLMEIQPETIRAQIATGVEAYRRWFGRNPVGFWLPECGFQPGVDGFLAEQGIRYFIVDSHGVLHALPRPRYAVYSPILCPGSAVAAFGRDWESSKQVWSATEGYPGDPDYREFYRDIGHDLDWNYISPWLKGGVRSHTGIKYHRVTGRPPEKQPYDPAAAAEKAAAHAGNFMFNRERQVEHLAAHMDRKPMVTAPYDAELFGHWWYEGPQWLDYLIRKIAFDQDVVGLATPGDYLQMYPTNQVALPSMSSWGYKGYSEVWLEGSNHWIYRYLHAAGQRMVELARRFPTATGVLQRALNQAARELMLAQASDWAFIMKTGTMVQYAEARTCDHLARLHKLHDQIMTGTIAVAELADLEARDNIFPDIDYRVYRPGPVERYRPSAGRPRPAMDTSADTPAARRV